MVNITGIGGMTHSRRFYALVTIDKVQPKIIEKAFKKKEMETIPKVIKGLVIDKEACEFIKFIKHNECSVVEKLNKLSARISLLALLLNSKPRQKALMRVLNGAYVAHNISV